jgi:hypothetical protein
MTLGSFMEQGGQPNQQPAKTTILGFVDFTSGELSIKNFQRDVTASRDIRPLHQRSQEIRGG